MELNFENENFGEQQVWIGQLFDPVLLIALPDDERFEEDMNQDQIVNNIPPQEQQIEPNQGNDDWDDALLLDNNDDCDLDSIDLNFNFQEPPSLPGSSISKSHEPDKHTARNSKHKKRKRLRRSPNISRTIRLELKKLKRLSSALIRQQKILDKVEIRLRALLSAQKPP